MTQKEKKSIVEGIANRIMIATQARLYNTNVYNYNKRCYNHADLMEAASAGIEAALNFTEE